MGKYTTNIKMSGLSNDGSTLVMVSSSGDEAGQDNIHLNRF